MPNRNGNLLDKAGRINDGFFPGLFNDIKLIARLIGDRRVSFWLKFLPLGALIYLVIPTDILPIIPLDDALILFLGGYLFIELCPQEVVQEHREEISKSSQKTSHQKGSSDDVIDAEFKEISQVEEQD
jgi:uncharacterized membrane protein YkvA (DUF1232 family)